MRQADMRQLQRLQLQQMRKQSGLPEVVQRYLNDVYKGQKIHDAINSAAGIRWIEEHDKPYLDTITPELILDIFVLIGYLKGLKGGVRTLGELARLGLFSLGKGGLKGVIKRSIRGIDVSFDALKMQRKFSKHAKVFDMNQNYKPAILEKFIDTLSDFMLSHDTQIIKGTHRGTELVWHFYDPSTNKIVIVNQKTGEFISAWQLGGKQLEWFLMTGEVK